MIFILEDNTDLKKLKLMKNIDRKFKIVMLGNYGFIIAIILTSFLLLEMYCRIFYPFHYTNKLQRKEHGEIEGYDPLLGWSGVPESKSWLDCENNSVLVENNRFGFRDIEHNESSNKPAIVFLGSSFEWGYEVEFNEMSVNLVRDKLKNYEIFNLSVVCYGTDQKLLTFKKWLHQYLGQIKVVILMFTDADVQRNRPGAYTDCHKPKPYFEIVQNKLVLRNVPVPTPPLKRPDIKLTKINSGKEVIKNILFKSYFLHEISVRYAFFRNKYMPDTTTVDNSKPYHEDIKDLELTDKILEEIKRMTDERGSKLVVFFTPGPREIEDRPYYTPYQKKLMKICPTHDIKCVDLAPSFKNSWWRTYYPENGHWNAYGHKVAAEAIYSFLIDDTDLKIQSK